MTAVDPFVIQQAEIRASRLVGEPWIHPRRLG